MALLGWLWLVTPFVVIALIACDEQLQLLVSSHYTSCRAAGLTGAAMMVLGAALVPGALGKAMFVLGTPLSGLVVFLRRDDDGGDEHEPEVPPLDWDDFERSFRTYVRASSPRRPRTPSMS